MHHAPPVLVFAALLAGCSKDAPPPTEPAAPTATAEPTAPAVDVVPNTEAQLGDTTTCPYSGRTFVVAAEHPKVDYNGKSYTICSDKAAQAVREDPDKYLADFDG